MIAKISWCGKPTGHWLLHFPDATVRAKWVRFSGGTTDLKEDGFMYLEGGPRGIIVADVETWDPYDAASQG